MYMLYSISLRLYHFAIMISSLFNEKAKLWLTGRKHIFQKMKNTINPGDKTIWVHCASLGEFEQGRPIIEYLKQNYPDYKILLTFFSPSGYEIRKNYEFADYIFYMPFDFKANVKKFIELTNIQFAIFIKYEFWYNYLTHLHKQNIFFLWYIANM